MPTESERIAHARNCGYPRCSKCGNEDVVRVSVKTAQGWGDDTFKCQHVR